MFLMDLQFSPVTERCVIAGAAMGLRSVVFLLLCESMCDHLCVHTLDKLGLVGLSRLHAALPWAAVANEGGEGIHRLRRKHTFVAWHKA